MNLTNRPLTGREYKLMLNTERFRDRKVGADLFWKALTFLVEQQGGAVLPDTEDKEKDVEQQRMTWYLDTPSFELRRANVILRVREELDAKKRYKITLKYRAPDRYAVAGADVSCSQGVKKDDLKFEEDVTPPFISKFSNSVSFKTDDPPDLEHSADLVALFPGLLSLDLPKARLHVVNGFKAYEVLHYLGKLKFENQGAAQGPTPPDFVIKVALSHWYLRPDENDYPLITEFSFSYNATTIGVQKDHLEQFPPIVIAGANRLFQGVQNQAGWLAQLGSTKTAYVFDVL